MIRIPFNRCVILTTLDFSQIADRLESAIYVGQPAGADPDRDFGSAGERAPNSQRYIGQIRDFKFLATRIVGHKYLHLPLFFLPSIEGKIHALHHGYEISLSIKLHDITLVLLLTWLGGLSMTIYSILDNILVGSKNPQYVLGIEILAVAYLAVLAYFYLDAWLATKFFKNLFVRELTGFAKNAFVNQPSWSPSLQFQDAGAPDSTMWLRKNLPSFPSDPGKV
jgi:hypothetical protein